MKIFLDRFKEPLLKSSSILFVTSTLGGAINYLFQIFMGRLLSIENYAVLISLLSLLAIISVPKESIRAAVVKGISPFIIKKNFDGVCSTYYVTLRVMSLICLLAFGVYILILPVTRNFLKLDSSFLVLLVGVIFCINLLLPVNLGILQGLKKFFLFGATSVIGALLKLVLGVVLVYLGFKVSDALSAIIISGLLVFFISFLFVKRNFVNTSYSKETETAPILKSSLTMLLPFLLISILMHVDIILVKHYFPEKMAGLYSACAVLGRVALYFPGAIIIAMFSMVAHSHSSREETTRILWKSLLYTFISSGLIILVYFFIPEFLLTLTFGQRYSAIAYLLGLYGLAMLPIALIRIITNFQMARGEYSFVYSLLVGTVLMFIFINFWHNSLKQVLGILFGVGISLFIYNLITLLAKEATIKR